MLESVVTVQIEPDYFQFYLRRAGAAWASDQTTSAGYEAHLWSNGEFVMIGTLRKFGTTPVVIEVWGDAPEGPEERWQHVAETSLSAGGDLEVFSWAADTPAAVVRVSPGSVRLRAMWAGLVEHRFEGLDDEGESDEHLTLQLWAAPFALTSVTRWWSGWALPPASDRSADGRRQIEGLESVLAVLPRLRALTDRRTFRSRSPMPGGGMHSSLHAVLFDPADGSWWVDGYDVRRTLREITQEEAQSLMRDPGDPASP